MNALSFSSSIPGAAQSGQVGIAQGIAGFDKDAQLIAQSAAGSGSDLAPALIDSLQQKLSVEASAKVLAASGQMLGSLIDVMA